MTFVLSVDDLIADDTSGLLAKHETWQRVRLAEVANVLNGYPFDSAHFSRDSGTPLLRIRDVLRGKTETYFDGKFPKEYLVERGDLLVGMDGDFHCANWQGNPALLNQRVCKISTNIKVFDRVFLRHLLPAYLKRINDATPSITVKHLSSRTIQDISLPLPPLPEQQRLAGKLDELFSDLDAGVAALQRARANLKRYRAAVLKAAVEGRLTAEWRARHPPTETGAELLARLLRERRLRWEQTQLEKFEAAGKAPPKNWRSKYVEPAAPDAPKLPALPNGWCWTNLEQLVERSEYGSSVKCSYDAQHQPVLRIPNIAKGEIDLSDIKFATVNLGDDPDDYVLAGDLLVCRTNGSVSLIGKCAVVKDAPFPPHHFASYLLRFRLTERDQLPTWVHMFLSSVPGRQFIERNAASSAGQHNISLSTLHQMPIPLPPLDEADAAFQLASQTLLAIDHQEQDIERALLRSTSLRQSILKRAFAGKLVPQDPADEPASVLLDRIRATRAAMPSITRAPSKPKAIRNHSQPTRPTASALRSPRTAEGAQRKRGRPRRVAD